MPSFSPLLAALLAGSSLVAAQVTGTYPPVPLASKHYNSIDEVPYKVDTDVGLIRGTQAGFNICNSTTQNQQSMCQTSWFNGPDDFCLWGPPDLGHMVGDIEGEMVAWCTKPGHGTRLIPAGALKGVQFIKTPAYIQVVGFLAQENINMSPEDWGGEMDPHGADLRGNPMGGLVWSTAFGGTKQIIEWTNFMGGNRFCLKACDPANADQARFCEHRFDRIGCDYNVPNNAQNGTFESCKGDNMDFPGIYTDEAGAVQTYTQPPESLGAISTMPYKPKVPASSECTPLTSSLVYTGLPSPTVTPAAPAATATGSGASGLATVKGTGAAASSTKSGSAASASQTSAASGRTGVEFVMALFSVVAAVAVLL